MNRHSTLSRILTATAACVLGAGLAAAPATAVSPPIPYSCQWTVGDTEGAGGATATWDSGVPDDFTVPKNVSFSLAPFTGTVVVPDTFVQQLRDLGVAELAGTGQLQIIWDAAGGYGEDVIGLSFAATPVPPSGPMTLDLTGVSGLTTFLNEEEPWSMVAWDFSLTAESGTSTLTCHPDTAATIDTVNTMVLPATTTPASTSATPTSSTDTAAPSPSATRPALVQTDRAPAGAGGLPVLGLGLGGVLLLVGGSLGARAGRVRRH